MGLLVDQARVWAEPQATLLIFLPCSAVTSRGLWMAFVVPSPSWPSSLSPHVYTSPEANTSAQHQTYFYLPRSNDSTLQGGKTNWVITGKDPTQEFWSYRPLCSTHSGVTLLQWRWLFFLADPELVSAVGRGHQSRDPDGGNHPFPWGRHNVNIQLTTSTSHCWACPFVLYVPSVHCPRLC